MSLESALAFVTKEIKDCSIRPLSAFPNIQVTTIDSGSLVLNRVLGRGGWPKGHIVEIYGGENSGKTTLCYHAIAEAQKSGIVCAMVDAEHRVDPQYAKALGVNIDELLFCQPYSGEDCLDSVYGLLKSGDIGLIVVDSIDAIRPKQEDEGDFGDAYVGKHAKLMGEGLRTFSRMRGNCCMLFTNQIRENPGKMFGNPEYTPGGRAMKFYASIRLEVRRGQIDENERDEKTGNEVKVKCVKNSVAPPFREGILKLVYGKGIDQAPDILEAAVMSGLIIKKGSYYKLIHNDKETSIGQGEIAAIRWINENNRLEKLRRFVKQTRYYLEETGQVESERPRERKAEQVPEISESEEDGDSGGLVSFVP